MAKINGSHTNKHLVKACRQKTISGINKNRDYA
jgi:hypothetical protein